jgi:hypothetical protein
VEIFTFVPKAFADVKIQTILSGGISTLASRKRASYNNPGLGKKRPSYSEKWEPWP